MAPRDGEAEGQRGRKTDERWREKGPVIRQGGRETESEGGRERKRGRRRAS